MGLISAQVARLASGATPINFADKSAPAYLKTVSDILNGMEVEARRFIDTGQWSAIADGTSNYDCSPGIRDAVQAGAQGLVFSNGRYNVSESIDLRDRAFTMRGVGLPIINKLTLDAPVVLVGGERLRLDGFLLKFATMPTAAQRDAVCIRGYNLYESIISRVYMMQMHTGIDQYQGTVHGGQNAFFSNRLADLRIINYRGWAAKMLPWLGGNSGNRWDNIYINNRGQGVNAADSSACEGAIWLQTAQNDVFNLLNVEWMRNSAPAIVLNQAGNPSFQGLHFEGLYPTGAYNPLIGISGGDKSCPTFSALTAVACDFSGAVGQGLFRLDNQGTRVRVDGLLSDRNTGKQNMAALIQGGATCYGSTLEVTNVCDDGTFGADVYSPKFFYGAEVAGVEVPIQRWGQSIARHAALVTDNAGGSNATNGAIGGTVPARVFDEMGLWDAINTRFIVKRTGNYRVSMTMPNVADAVVYVQRNYQNVATLMPSANGTANVDVQFARGDTLLFYLASGAYVRTNVSFGLSLL